MATKAELQAALDAAGVAYNPKAVKAELEVLLESVEFRQEPEETPAPAPAKPTGPQLVKIVADKAVTMDGESRYPDGVRVHWTNNTAWVPKGVAGAVAARESGVTVTDETRPA